MLSLTRCGTSRATSLRLQCRPFVEGVLLLLVTSFAQSTYAQNPVGSISGRTIAEDSFGLPGATLVRQGILAVVGRSWA